MPKYIELLIYNYILYMQVDMFNMQVDICISSNILYEIFNKYIHIDITLNIYKISHFLIVHCTCIQI